MVNNRIALAAKPVGVANALSNAEQIRGQRAQNRLREVQADQAEGEVALEEQVNNARLIKETTDRLSQLSDEELAEGVQIAVEGLGQRGIELTAPEDLSDPAALRKMVTNFGARAGDFIRANTPEREGFTLSPGSRRFDADGNLVAQAPVAERSNGSVTLADGTRIDLGGTRPASIGSGGADDPLEAGERQGLTKTTTNKVQQAAISQQERIGRIQQIRAAFKPEFLTYQGRAEGAIANAFDKANLSGPEQKEFIRERTEFQQLVEQEFNQYRKEITGAAAAVAELDRLKKAFINLDMGPTAFDTALSLYEREQMRGLRIKRRLLREGVAVGDDAFGEQFDDLFIGGADDNIEIRGAELEQQFIDDGATEEEAFQQAAAQLRSEGYQF